MIDATLSLRAVADPDLRVWRGQIEKKKFRGGKNKKIKNLGVKF
jgi:hypothetical protein